MLLRCNAQFGIAGSCGVNKCPYLDPPAVGVVRSSPSTWHALIFVLLCNAVSVVLTALLPSLLSGNVRRSTSSSAAAMPVLRWQATPPLDDSQRPDGYRMVGPGTAAGGAATVQSMRRKTMTTLYLFVNRRLLMLVPTIIVAGLAGSLTVAAFHQVRRAARRRRISSRFHRNFSALSS